jgi:CubicO group peptidase (beta-lactamase class C family)
MQATIPEIQGRISRDLATFYSPSPKGFRHAIPVNNEYKLAGGGYLSTAADIARFGQAYLDGLIGTPALVGEFLKARQIGGKPTWYGLGWEVSRDTANRPFYGHTGNSVGAFSKFLVYPEARMVFVILVNCGNPGIETETEQFIDFFLREVKKEIST